MLSRIFVLEGETDGGGWSIRSRLVDGKLPLCYPGFLSWRGKLTEEGGVYVAGLLMGSFPCVIQDFCLGGGN